MCITEYDEARTMELFKEEGREEGRAEGRAEGEKKGREEGRAEGRAEGREEGEKKGREEGEKKGREEGEKKGRDEEKVSNLRNLMERLKMTAEAAMDALAVPQEEQQKYALLLKEAEAAEQYSAKG